MTGMDGTFPAPAAMTLVDTTLTDRAAGCDPVLAGILGRCETAGLEAVADALIANLHHTAREAGRHGHPDHA